MNTEDKRKYYREYRRKYRLRNSSQERESQKRYRDNNKDKRKNGMLLWRFNITLEEYQVLFETQGGVCKICNNPETAKKNKSEELRMLAVDHDHNTGKVRGLLCARCNVQLGHYEKTKPRAQEFENYLEEAVQL
jgi:hypothetical protein